MSIANIKKAQQLGMPYGTACNRLRKAVLFKLIKTAGLNVCYRCNNIIKNVDELSIDHKQVWLDSSDPVNLFFDLDNVAYSHTSCNYGNRRSSNVRRKGDKIRCYVCKKHKHLSNFHLDCTRNEGVSSRCKECDNKHMKRRLN